ncbi:peptide chain release factor 1 [Acetobacter orientalis]|uniref:Peptide chain release factor 1 n=1 Tax=Acetobacter orientalis TaxID=146474 RepID=A0A2Z5ZDP0_9PROT|nr:peptide chain release factor 1 [Acetobacter orientalis]
MTLDERLDRIVSRSLELEALLASGISGEAFTQASREYAEIEPVVAHINALRHAEQEAAQAELLLADPEMKELAEGELADIRERLPELSQNVRLAMLPRDAADERSAILEIRPAAGGMRQLFLQQNCLTFTAVMQTCAGGVFPLWITAIANLVACVKVLPK